MPELPEVETTLRAIEKFQGSKIQKVKIYFVFIAIIYILPLISNFLIFLLYDKSLKNARIDKEYFNKWWRI